METPHAKVLSKPVSPTMKSRDLENIGRTESDLKMFLEEREIEEIDSYLENLTTKEWKRLIALFRGDIAINFTFDEALNEFMNHCPLWRDQSTRTLLFDNYPEYNNMKVLRAQTTNICSAHADLVLVHLEKCIRLGPTAEVLMPDLTELLRRMFSIQGKENEFIHKYVSGNYKIATIQFLLAVYGINSNDLDVIYLNLRSSPELTERLDHDNMFMKRILKEHPALLSFEFGEDFRIPGCFSYDGTPECETKRNSVKEPKKPTCFHAMVVVGIRQDEGKCFYLCMNFWKTKFFVELSDEYVVRSNGKFTILHSSTSLDELLAFRAVKRFDGLSVETALYAETEDERSDEDSVDSDADMY